MPNLGSGVLLCGQQPLQDQIKHRRVTFVVAVAEGICVSVLLEVLWCQRIITVRRALLPAENFESDGVDNDRP